MKVIDVLQKIANGEKVRFRIDGKPYHCYKYDSLYDEEFGEEVEWFIGEEWLNKEVEIIEEEKKIPEKLNKDRYIGTDLSVEDDMFNKINEIIDYLQEKE